MCELSKCRGINILVSKNTIYLFIMIYLNHLCVVHRFINLSRQDEIYGKHICNKTASESGFPRNNFHFFFYLFFYHILKKEYLKGRVKIKQGKVLECTSIRHKLCLLLMQLHNSFLKGYYMYDAFQPCLGFLFPLLFPQISPFEGICIRKFYGLSIAV